MSSATDWRVRIRTLFAHARSEAENARWRSGPCHRRFISRPLQSVAMAADPITIRKQDPWDGLALIVGVLASQTVDNWSVRRDRPGTPFATNPVAHERGLVQERSRGAAPSS